jgi:hypothetical protein
MAYTSFILCDLVSLLEKLPLSQGNGVLQCAKEDAVSRIAEIAEVAELDRLEDGENERDD